MNKAKLKSYAPQARRDFIAAVTARANLLGLSSKAGKLEVAPSQTQGDVTVIAGQAWPSKVDGQRKQLISRILKVGFDHTMEAVAYTWFNRFAALRFMELHDYLGHGHRALSSASGGLPDILTYASDLNNADAGNILPGLNAAKVIELKLAGNRDGELYRMLLVAQCNALSRAMPFLFERIDDDSELLLPDNLLRSDSVIAKLVEEIPEEDWTEVEIIGWLYQFYISEKKDQVIGNVVKSEDIPAATQLFTPNWIVQYLVQNSVGRLWLMANPASTLAQEWPYYISPAEQTPEVQAQLDALIQTRVRGDGDTLNPESITVLDPACGSGHILVVAYDVLKAIYLERGYQARAIPRLILEKNLFGLDIDDRAAQMAGFALLMKARADDRRLFTTTDDAGNLQAPKLNVLSLQESKGLSVDELATHLATFKVQRATITALVDTFEHAKTFGSLIQIPYALKTHLVMLPEILSLVMVEGDMYASAAAADLLPLVKQAELLSMQFDAVVANPPYMGSKGMNDLVKIYSTKHFSDCKSDLFSMFMKRAFDWCKTSGFNSMVTMQSWMFLASYADFRTSLISEKSLSTLIHMPYDGKGPTAMGISFGTCAFVYMNSKVPESKAAFDYFRYYELNADGVPLSFPSNNERNIINKTDEFSKIPGSPIAYWVGKSGLAAFSKNSRIGSIATPRKGMATGDNNRYVRLWVEVDRLNIGVGMNRKAAKESGLKWFPYANGGGYRKWYGMIEDVVLWENDGQVLQTELHSNGNVRAVGLNLDYIFTEGVTWSPVTSAVFSSRLLPEGTLFSSAANALFSKKVSALAIMGQLNSRVFEYFSKIINPTFNLNTGDVGNIPILLDAKLCSELNIISAKLVDIYKKDWNFNEISLDFLNPAILGDKCLSHTLSDSCMRYSISNSADVALVMDSEFRINQLMIDAYGLNDVLSPTVVENEISLSPSNPEKDCQRMVSYAIGCMMGRYSLDESGLIYACAGNVGFDHSRYANFPADADGIVPLTDELWFEDDAANRIHEFLHAVWGADTLTENMAWLAESLGMKASETPDEAVRRYLADKFYKDHLQTYQKRPVYWLFSSGKQGAFQALVYLHRYSEGTLARLRAEYVVPLTGKMQSRIEMLQKDAAAASGTAARNKLTKEVEKFKKKHVELLAYDEQLRHFADLRITLNLDDGVKVNYGKFGDLLAEVKVITGGASDD